MMCKDWSTYRPTNDLNLQALKDVVRAVRAIAFIGAGCSIPLGYPSWAGLIARILDEIGRTKPSMATKVDMLREKNDDLLYVAGECKSLMGEKDFRAFIGREFQPKENDNHTEEHKLIIKLPFYNYMTSNYDSCLDSAYWSVENKAPSSFTYNNKQQLADYCTSTVEPQRKIFHIHGRYDNPQDIVLTEEDYKGAYQEGFISSLRSIIMTHTVVFIGSGVNDPDFLNIMRFIDHVFMGCQGKHYAIISWPASGYAEIEAGRLQSKYNITPVFYEIQGDKHTERAGILRDILDYCNDATAAKPTPKAVSKDSKEYELKQYKVKLDAELTNLRILDMSRPLNLLDIYIKINLRTKVKMLEEDCDDTYGKLHLECSSPGEMGIPRLKAERESKPMSIEEALTGYKKRIVILGDPGAGKTTLLKHITLKMAADGVETIKGIPIFITLRDYINKYKPDLLDYIDDDLSRRYGFSHARTYLEEEFKSGNVAIFFDGLDEVSGGNREEASSNYLKVVEVINDVATNYINCPIAVTCRKAGWKGGIKEAFSIFEVIDFTHEDIANFVGKWFRGTPEKAKSLNSQLSRKTRVKSLAGNPLLLSFVCILYDRFGIFPKRRGTLYQRCVDVLLSEWDESRRIERRSIFDQDDKKRLLQDIAYRFFDKGEKYFKEDDLISAIQECLPDLYLKPKEAKDILNEIAANHGLLKEQADGWYGFIHLTIQEYFAAHQLKDNRNGYDIAIANSFKPWWEEVILLLAGIGDSTDLIKGLFDKPDDIFDHNLILAGRCLAEKPTLKGGVKLREVVLKKLKGIVTDGTYRLNTDRAIDVLAENGEFGFLLGLLRDDKLYSDVQSRIAYALGNIGDSSIVADL
ncbi:MAG: SIR2 family protein, partial [Nitrospirae bacterium]|nr:SIR2 family protein [Nitrospirota bacterium]